MKAPSTRALVGDPRRRGRRSREAIAARHGQLPAVAVAGRDLTRPATEPGARPRPVLVIRLDATLIEAASPKAQAAGHYKGGLGFHPLTGWCDNIGDALAVMQRPGTAGSFTAADHLAVLKAAFAQITDTPEAAQNSARGPGSTRRVSYRLVRRRELGEPGRGSAEDDQKEVATRRAPTTHRFATMEDMPVPSARVKTSTEGHLDFHASQRWPQLEEITISWRGGYGYVTAHLPDDEQLPLCRLRYLGSDTDWGFALYRASTEDYDDTRLPDGSPSGTPEQALDCALGLYLSEPSACSEPPKD